MPHILVAADWSKNWEGRWQTQAVLSDAGYEISHPRPVGPPEDFLPNLLKLHGDRTTSILVGLDFPIGLPHQYAVRRVCQRFPDWLASMEPDEWESFSAPTDSPTISQPFGPLTNPQKGLTEDQLAAHLKLELRGLYRQCDLQCPRTPAPLFFLRFANQVGKAALHGWDALLRPMRGRIALWPFDGTLEDLVLRGGIVLAEIYPSLAWAQIRKGSARGKSTDSLRRAAAPRLKDEVARVGARLTDDAEDWVDRGFAASHDFDAFVGLLGMISTLREGSDGGLEGKDPGGVTRSEEGWMLGLRPGG